MFYMADILYSPVSYVAQINRHLFNLKYVICKLNQYLKTKIYLPNST